MLKLSTVDAPQLARNGKGMLFCSDASKIVAAIQLAAAIIVAAAWVFGVSHGQVGGFDRVGLPIVAGLLAAMSLAAWKWPRFTLTSARLPLLTLLSIYVQSSLFVALFMHGQHADSQAIVRLGLSIPLLYLASFALLVRQGYVLPLVQSVLVSAQCLTALAMRWGQLQPDVVQSLFMIAVLQPLYLSLLYWINHQRRATIASQEAAAASKMTMLAMVSHELRSPLQTIVGSLDALERRMGALNLPKAELIQVQRMRSASTLVYSHLNDLLVVTRQGGGLTPPRRQPFRLDQTLQALVENYVGAARDRGCLVRLELGPGCEEVEGDALRVHQIVNNLVNNAVKYTREGEICVTALRVAESSVEISVQDTGIGIDEAKVASIWEPHVRLVSDPQVELSEGCGLGLTVVRLLVDMLAGTISLRSERNKGTTVTVRLPLPQP